MPQEVSSPAPNRKLIVLVGPTAVGKTSTAIALAKHLGSEIVSADSRQLFRELNIGTAKPTEAELAEVPHHLINSHSILQHVDAAQYAAEALAIINRLFETNSNVILCGGSGLYVQAVCDGFDEIPPIPSEIRETLIGAYETNGLAWLQAMMNILDPEHLARIDSQNPHRLLRALEVRMGTGKSISTFQQRKKSDHAFEIVKIGLELPREELYERIDTRMDQMIAAGLFDEAEQLFPKRRLQALQTVGYQEIFGFFDKLYDRDETVRLLKRNSRRYAKRQLTWFKRDTEIAWFSANDRQAVIDYLRNV